MENNPKNKKINITLPDDKLEATRLHDFIHSHVALLINQRGEYFYKTIELFYE
ncbi:hypothetical protein MACH08_07570 [Oceanobacillus kimchii]|uniref:Uncharacterized protein n=1 Tax=Oceanobacillus kimchii TaxID=746691 RepID=A0ABQ5TDW8_9BACI|nr:hypothetical protein MACH08_07570 [Oceanobacillus kimchii]